MKLIHGDCLEEIVEGAIFKGEFPSPLKILNVEILCEGNEKFKYPYRG